MGVLDGDGEPVAGLVAEGVRPPATNRAGPDLDVGDDGRAAEVGSGHGHLMTVGIRQADADGHVGGSGTVDLDPHGDRTGAVGFDRGHRSDRGDARDVPADQLGGPPDAGRGQPWSPVPPPAARHLAHVVEGSPERRRRPVALPLPPGLRLPRGGAKADGDGGAAAAAGDVDAIGAVHVLGLCHDRAVEGNGGERVETVEHQLGAIVTLDRGEIDGGAVLPVGVGDPGDSELIGVGERVGDQAGRQEVGVHAAGHGRRHPVDRDRAVAADVAQGPGGRQRPAGQGHEAGTVAELRCPRILGRVRRVRSDRSRLAARLLTRS